MGSLFNGITGGGGGKGNSCKSITTRSGCALTLNDAEGSVTLNDKGGANMNFDGGGNASTTANSAVRVSAGKQVKTDVGNGQSVLAMDKDGIIDLSGHKKITFKVGSSSITITADNIRLESSSVDVDGGGGTIHAAGIVEVDGGDVFIN